MIPGDMEVMKKPLLDVIFASEKRKNVLLLLKDGPQEMEYLIKSLETRRQSLLPQIRTLEEHYLVTHDKDTYELTVIGKLTVNSMTPLVSTTEALDIDIDYWGTHNLDFIPSYLLKRIGQLEKCKAHHAPIMDMYELNQDVLKRCYMSKSLFKMIASFHPKYPALFQELFKLNVNINCIISDKLYHNLLKNHYDIFEKAVINSAVNFFVYPKEMNFFSITYNDYFLIMRLLNKDGSPDSSYALCSNPDALEWGKELFEYYLKDSTLITKI